MKKKSKQVYYIELITCFFFIFQCSKTENKLIDYVDPFICTLGDHGQLHPGAAVPFGMIKLGPDTYPSSITGDGDWAHSGYNYADDLIRGFSHLRIESSGGTSVFDRGWYLAVQPIIGTPHITPEKYATIIDKKNEKASPGLYQVYLKDHKIHVALTVDKHVGFHKYIFPKSKEAFILFDMGSKSRINQSSIQVASQDEIVGEIFGMGQMFFYAKLSKPFNSFSTWEVKNVPNQKEIKGKKVGAILNLETRENEIVYLKVGVSAISIEQARKNLEMEVPAWDFDGTVLRARNAWNKVLDKIIVEGEEEYKKIFYTALYNSFMKPSITTDVDNRYPGYDKKIHTAIDYTHYDNYAFWDDYRTKYPLYSLIAPKAMHDIVLSIIDIYEQSSDYWFYGDSLHRPHESGFVCAGPSGYRPFLNCRNEHMLTTVLDAYAKKIVSSDFEEAYKGMRKEAMVQMPDKFEKTGYIPARPDQTCELAYDNWCVAQMAAILDNSDDYNKFMNRATFYQNTWDSSIGFFRARAKNGEWLDFPESPNINREKYMYEGTPWQWRWYVPHDIQGLINLVGDREKFVSDLDYFFSNDLYQAGNQPDVQVPFLFNYAGAPWLTQKWVRKILTEPMTQLYGTHQFFEQPIHGRIFKTTPDGFLREMDDDYGSMSAWFVISAMGLYQVCPGQPIYQLTAPIFNKVTLKLDDKFYSGEKFIIEANNLSNQNIYIQSAVLYDSENNHGQQYTKPWISHQEITNGGRLVFEMGPEPNREWGNGKKDAPPSMSK